ncbi:mycothiol transferase [Paractinoplanes brasiliensis]|uniref:Uncharacterized protein DUF664 n=1 Tax=Paractinoplanes brasiliensis TaxID=52695 RepID=A0A4V3C636_9ACTN|nr:DUF664 domain-containing protein [Actinoplanes brasiliensis]TDO32198.1 uncharacterized protein DUF664 [Actinoplanes brasiliensis]GID28251.1 mini-circle protein [Actinoplanes brasiliensis]
MTDIPWEPPIAGTEREHLLGALDRLRTTFRYKADGLDAYGLNARLGVSKLTLGGLLKHLALAEDYTFGVKFAGEQVASFTVEPWLSRPAGAEDDWEFDSAAHDKPSDLYEWYDDAVVRARARLDAAGSLDQVSATAWPDGGRPTLRRFVCDMLEEYGRHTGHADLLREAVDGRVGEDPPADWRPVSGRFVLPPTRRR